MSEVDHLQLVVLLFAAVSPILAVGVAYATVKAKLNGTVDTIKRIEKKLEQLQTTQVACQMRCTADVVRMEARVTSLEARVNEWKDLERSN